MRMANTLQRCLQNEHCLYDVVEHPHSDNSLESAREAGIPAERMAKPVILDDQRGHYLMAVLPANRHLDMTKVSQGGGRWQLTHEHTVSGLFKDCDLGAIPPLGTAYGMAMVIDPQLTRQKEVYFEAGDHEGLVHMRMDQFLKLVPRAEVREVSR